LSKALVADDELLIQARTSKGESLMHRFPHWGWLVLHGAINLLLGIFIWRQWPLSGLWVISLFIGIDMICNGWSLVMLGMAAKNIDEKVAKPASI
jgi:hypothetical protein